MEYNSRTREVPVAGAPLPPAMPEGKRQTVDEVLDEMKRIPLFMNSLDDVNDADGENPQLEALKAIAYEGTRSEIAGNFREQGNEAARSKQWKDAREFYDRAIHSITMTDDQLKQAKGGGDGPSDFEVLDTDPVEEKIKERQVLEASLVNRALCNLEMKNYGACNRDCAATLKMNPKNVKAWYRSATACLALDKLDEAADACNRGLEVEETNVSLLSLSRKIADRRRYLDELFLKRRQCEERALREANALKQALKTRNIATRNTARAPEMEDAVISLDEPSDPSSTLRIPTVLLYPLHAQSDFIKQFAENENLSQHLEYILPLPWDSAGEYTLEGVDCYVETVSGGLVKAGKNMILLRIISSGKVEIVDGMLKVNVVPRNRAKEWIEHFKKQRKG